MGNLISLTRSKVGASSEKVKTNRTMQRNAENVKTKVRAKVERTIEPIYNYGIKTEEFPQGIHTSDEKKKFRAAIRRHLHSLKRKIANAKGDDKSSLIKEARDFAKAVFNPEHVPSF